MKPVSSLVSVFSLLVSSGFSATDDECFGLMFNLARDTITDNCPMSDDLSVNCEQLDCFKDYVNILHALHIAECRDDIFACHMDPEGEQCKDEDDAGTVCHQGSGNCLKECSDDSQCNGGSDDGPSCMQGFCVESELELVQMPLVDKANQASGFCGIHEDTGMYCLYYAYGTFGALFAPDADTCGILESWGCCVGSVEDSMPGMNFSGMCPTLTKGPQCALDWVVKNPEVDEGDYNYMDEFCDVCQESNFDAHCATIAPALCRGVDFGYCSESACENFAKTGAPGQEEKCFDAVKASAAEACKEGDPPSPPSEDPPSEDPPSEDPPSEDPPSEDPPSEDPPSEDPPSEDPPSEDSPSDDSEPDSSSDDLCRPCSPRELKKERRHLNFMGDLPCCKSGRGWRERGWRGKM